MSLHCTFYGPKKPLSKGSRNEAWSSSPRKAQRTYFHFFCDCSLKKSSWKWAYMQSTPQKNNLPSHPRLLQTWGPAWGRTAGSQGQPCRTPEHKISLLFHLIYRSLLGWQYMAQMALFLGTANFLTLQKPHQSSVIDRPQLLCFETDAGSLIRCTTKKRERIFR